MTIESLAPVGRYRSGDIQTEFPTDFPLFGGGLF